MSGTLRNRFVMIPAYLLCKLRIMYRSRYPSKQDPPKTSDLTYYIYESRRQQYETEARANKTIGIKNPRNGIFYNFKDSYTDLDGVASLRLAADKIYCYELLQRLRQPVPPHIALNRFDLEGVLAFKNQCPAGIVIKPARDTGDATGVSIKPEGLFKIIESLAIAGVYGREVLVEQFCEGTNYRLLYCDGAFIAASIRLPAALTGDGRSTVLDLIKSANRGRAPIGELTDYSPETRPILYRIPMDQRVRSVLRKQRLSLNSVPAQGRPVRLQDICHWLWGGSYLDVTEEVCPQLTAAGADIVKALGVRLAGLDVIAKDISDCAHGGYVINEINTTPALLVHYEVQNRDKLRPVAKTILAELFGAST